MNLAGHRDRRLSENYFRPMNFNWSSPEEFRWKIFLGEDLQPLAVLSLDVLCHLHKKLLVIHQSHRKHRFTDNEYTHQPFMNEA